MNGGSYPSFDDCIPMDHRSRCMITLPLTAVWCQQHRGDASLSEVMAGMQEEIDLYRRTGHSYGYVFYILRKA